MTEALANSLIDPTSQLTSGITSSSSTLPVGAPTAPDGWPTTGSFVVKVENELIRVTASSGSATSLTVVERGSETTTAASHSSGASVELIVSLEAFRRWLENVQDHGNAGSTETVDVSSYGWHTLTLDANCTITVSGFASGRGRVVIVKLTQDATGGRSVTWDTDVVFAGDDQPVQTANASTFFLLWTEEGDSTVYGARAGGLVSEDDLLLSDVTTANATTARHGLLRKLTGDITAFLRADGEWDTPPGTGEILISDSPSTPLVFADLVQNEAQTDLIYSD